MKGCGGEGECLIKINLLREYNFYISFVLSVLLIFLHSFREYKWSLILLLLLLLLVVVVVAVSYHF